MPVHRPGQRLGPVRQRRRARRATTGQVHLYVVPNHLDEANIVRWGLTAEQMLCVLVGASLLAVVTIVLLLGGLVVVRPMTGQRAAWWNLAPLLLLLLIRPLATFARWLPEATRDEYAWTAPFDATAPDEEDDAPLEPHLAHAPSRYR